MGISNVKDCRDIIYMCERQNACLRSILERTSSSDIGQTAMKYADFSLSLPPRKYKSLVDTPNTYSANTCKNIYEKYEKFRQKCVNKEKHLSHNEGQIIQLFNLYNNSYYNEVSIYVLTLLLK